MTDSRYPSCTHDIHLDSDGAWAPEECEVRRFEWLLDANLPEVLPKFSYRDLTSAFTGNISHPRLREVQDQVLDEMRRRELGYVPLFEMYRDQGYIEVEVSPA